MVMGASVDGEETRRDWSASADRWNFLCFYDSSSAPNKMLQYELFNFVRRKVGGGVTK